MKSRTNHLSAVTRAAHTAVALGTYQGACLVHARAQQCNEIKNSIYLQSRMQQRRQHRRHTARRVPRPCPCRCNEINNRHVQQRRQHRRHTKHVPRRASSMPVHNSVMKSRTDHLSAVTHAAEAATQETHCSCTRHVPRRVPRPCPCTTGVMKSTTDHLSAITHAAERRHCSCTGRHTAVAHLGTYQGAVPRPCPCTTGVMKSTTDHLSAVTHAAEATAQKTHCSCTRHVPRRVPRPCPCSNALGTHTQETHCSCTRHVPRRMPRPCPCPTGVMK